MKVCNDCGMQNPDVALFCRKCGNKLEDSVQTPIQSQLQQNTPIEINPIDFSASTTTKPSNKKRIIIACSLVGIIFLGIIVAAMSSTSKNKPVENEYQYTENYNNYDSDSSSDNYINIDTTKSTESDMLTVDSDDSSQSFDSKLNLSVSASSQLEDEMGFNYSPNNLFDGDYNTCWAEGVSDGGINQSIFIESSEAFWIKSLSITNGYCKSFDLYNNNNRVKKIKISFDDKELYFELSDNYDNPVNILSFEPVKTSSIMITIIDIYVGEKWNDTCISEIAVN